MKLLKFIIALIVTVSFTSCGDGQDTPEFSLSSANLVGNYKMNSLTAEISEDAMSSNGATVNLTKISTVGDTFQLNLVMNANNSYTASGQYRVVSTITNNGEEPTEESEIVVIDASGGSYQLNSNNTITFNPQDDEFFEGVFIIETFNETSIILSQKDIEVDGNTTFTVEAAAGFIRE
jgi:hypothetical protein